MEGWKRKIIRHEGYKLLRQLDLEPELRGCLYSKHLISDQQYQQLEAFYEEGKKIRAAELCLRYISNAGRVDNGCPFDSFVSALEEIVDRGGSSSNGDVAKHLQKAASSEGEFGLGQPRSQSLGELTGFPTTRRRFCSESETLPPVPCRGTYIMLVLGDMFCTPYPLEPYSTALDAYGEDRQSVHNNTHSGTPYSYVTLVKEVALYGWVEVCLVGCRVSDEVSTSQLLQEVLQNVEKLPCGVILLLDISQTEEIVMSEVTRLKRVLCDYSHANLSQVKSVMVPAAALNATVGGYRRAPESQEQIRHHAIQLGIDTFLSNLSEAITDLLSHNINSRHCEESHTAAASSSKSAPRSKHRRCRSETSFPSSHRREGHSPHSGSMSDAESKGSDGSEYTTRHKCIIQQASSSLSPGMRYRRSWSSAHSSLPTIAQSPPENQIPCGVSSAETMSLDDNSQPNANGDDCQSLPFSSQPTDCLDDMASGPPMLSIETVGTSSHLCSSTKTDWGRGETATNCEQNPFYTATSVPDMDNALNISVSEANKKRMIESAPALLGNNPSKEPVNTSSVHGCQRRRRCTIL